ncbi:hypothetical protein EV421DRAFT_1740967 [Armillaria borealis]|uniref:Uncharacterized protein n=1 Tax=Armillaria borealis TaxID=47425 RepID=A0AA39J3T8_9AGAR|nr:hypothetical protein EV421DRAFT_1740967 [Armillaria borealis]
MENGYAFLLTIYGRKYHRPGTSLRSALLMRCRRINIEGYQLRMVGYLNGLHSPLLVLPFQLRVTWAVWYWSEEAIRDPGVQLVFKRLPWRSDTIDDKECGPEEQWEQRITNWLYSVEGCRHSLPSASPLPSLRPVYLLALWLPDALHEFLPELVPNQSMAVTSGPNFVPPRDDVRGRSQLGAKALEGIGSGAKLSFSNYSHDRKMASIANVKLPAGAAGVDPRMMMMTARLGLDSDDTDLGPIKELDQELWDIIDGSFSHLLRASVGTYTKLLEGKIHNEAEAHHNWDAQLDLGSMGSMDDAVQTIIQQGMAEPDFGICDAILMLPVDLRCKITEPLIRLTDTGDSLQAAKLKMLTDDRIEEQEDRKSSLQRNASSNSKGQSRESKSVNPSRRSDLGSITEEHDGLEPLVQNRMPAQKSTGESANEDKTHSDEQANEKEKDWQNPFAVTCSETFNEPEGLLMAVIDIQELLTRLLLAVLVAEHKKPTTSYKKALYQVNMYHKPGGILGLATNGVRGAILMVWFSEITDVYHFATVLLRLRRDSDTRLKELVEGVVGKGAFVQTTWSRNENIGKP